MGNATASAADDTSHDQPVEGVKPVTHIFDYSLNNQTLSKLTRMGLGMGVDCLSPTSDLLDQQIDPAAYPLLQLTLGIGYKAFKTDLRDWYTLNRDMYNSLVSQAGSPVKIDVGMDVKRKSQSRIHYRCEGYMVHTRTIRLSVGNAIAIVPSLDSPDGTASLSRLDLLLSRKKVKTGTEKERIEICRGLLKEENRGATHYISSIELGAKIYHTRKTGVELSSWTEANVNFSASHLDAASRYENHITANVHPEMEMKGSRTVVKPEQENVIGYEVRPVWLLVSDMEWQLPMKLACKLFVDEQVAMGLPIITSGGPFLLGSGDCFLQLTQGEDQSSQSLKGTTNRQDANLFFIEIPHFEGSPPTAVVDDDSDDPLQDPHFGFYIYCKENDGKLFLSADSRQESNVSLVSKIPSTDAYYRFYLEFPSTRLLAPLSRWAKEPLHLVRKTAYTGRNQYLVIEKRDNQLVFISEKRLDDNPQALCQFTIQNPRPTNGFPPSEES